MRSPCRMFWSVAGTEPLSLSNDTRFGVSLPADPSDSLVRVVAGSCWSWIPGESIEGRELGESASLRIFRPTPRSLAHCEGDWEGRAESLSELVSLDDEDSESRVIREMGLNADDRRNAYQS